MAEKLVLKVESFKNNLDQVINPGDEVIIVTTGYSHRVSISRGTYLGTKNTGVHCRVQEHRTKYRHKTTGIEVDSWYSDKRIQDLPYPKWQGQGLRYGTPEYTAEQARYLAANEERQAKVQEVINEYQDFKVPYFRHTTLQLNRIYKLDTNAWDLST